MALSIVIRIRRLAGATEPWSCFVPTPGAACNRRITTWRGARCTAARIESFFVGSCAWFPCSRRAQQSCPRSQSMPGRRSFAPVIDDPAAARGAFGAAGARNRRTPRCPSGRSRVFLGCVVWQHRAWRRRQPAIHVALTCARRAILRCPDWSTSVPRARSPSPRSLVLVGKVR